MNYDDDGPGYFEAEPSPWAILYLIGALLLLAGAVIYGTCFYGGVK